MKSMTKRMASVLLALLLAAGTLTVGLPGLRMVAHAASVWDGEYNDASGFSNNTITSARGFVYFLRTVTNNGTTYSGQTIRLAVDVDLNDRELSDALPYNSDRSFQGTFDGQNHTISNFRMTHDNHRVAMFRTAKDATIRNVTVTNVFVDDWSANNKKNGFAVFVGYGDGNLTFENAHITNGQIYGYNYVGGFIGEYGANNTASFTNCSNGAMVYADHDRAGGLIGHSKGSVVASSCTNTGLIHAGSSDAGGLVGWIEDDASSFTNCTNTGEVTTDACAGGILGYFGSKSNDNRMTLIGCTNTGNITSNSKTAGGLAGILDTDNNAHIFTNNVNRGTVWGKIDAGGIVGSNFGFGTWNNCYNYGNVTCSDDNAGGILGEVEDDLQTFANCYNTGDVQGKNSVGGVLGYGNAGAHTFNRCANSGAITSTNGAAGGIYGYGSDSQAVHEECWNIGTVRAYTNAGGIAGYSNHHLIFRRCFNAGTIDTYNHSGNNAHGGIVGSTGNLKEASASNPTVEDCFNWGAVRGGEYNAGIVAWVKTGNTNVFGGGGNRNYYVKNSYNAGEISTGTAKAIVSDGGNGVTDCYFLDGTDPSDGWGVSKSAQELIDFSNYTLSSNYCKNTWGVSINGTTYYYPVLTWYRDMFSFTSVFEDSVTGTDETITRVYNNSFTTPNPTRAGYTAGNWFNVDNANQTLGKGVAVNAGVTAPTNVYVVTQNRIELTQITNTTMYHLIWTPNQYTITFLPNGGSAVASITQAYESAITPPADPTREGYTFTGWSPALPATMPLDGLTVTAQWSINSYTITYVTNGGTAVPAATLDYGVALPAASTVRDGHYFNGWVYEGNGAVYTGATMPAYPLTATAQWIRVTNDDTFVLDFGLPVRLSVLSNDAAGAALKSVTADGEGFTAVKDGDQICFTPTAALSQAATFTYTVTYNGAEFTATVTVIPANTVYYEESFVTFASEPGAPAWQEAGAEFTGKFQNGARPGDADSPVYGFDAVYDDANEATYSLGHAKYVTVKKGDRGATAAFTFTGTGFDFYSVTDNESGLAFVDIYKIENGTETNIESSVVNTYFGYQYGRLYLDGDRVTLTQTETPVYYAPEGQTDGTFFVQGTTRGWTSPSYYDPQGAVVAGAPADAGKAAYAYGWVAGANAVNGIYQVPVISRTGLPYGTYKVVVEPRYSARQDLTGNGEYKFYVDAVRVYDPIDPETITAGSAVYSAYQLDGELNAHYQAVRALLLEAESFGSADGHGAAGVAFLEEGKGENLLQDYADIGPKNEVYLARGQAIAFNLTTASAVTPAKLSVGLRMAAGSNGEVTVYAGDSSAPLTVNGNAELYREITGVVRWQQTTGGVYATASPIILVNTSNSDVVISVTKVKWSYQQTVAAAARALKFSFAPQDLATASAVLRQAKVKTVAPDASSVQLQWNTRTIRRGGTATLVITAPASFEKAYFNGAEIAGYTENADGTRSWRYDFTGSAVGKHAFDVKLTDANGYSTDAISAGTVEVIASANGQKAMTLQALLDQIFGSFFRALRAIFGR